MSTRDGFSDIEIDISEELLQGLTQMVDKFITENLRPCSYNIWEIECENVDSVYTLSHLFGDCLVNDLLVELIESGLKAVVLREKDEIQEGETK